MTTEKKYTPHVHAEVIKAWADGKPIQFCHGDGAGWRDYTSVGKAPRWWVSSQYRVKPEEVVDYTIVFSGGTAGANYRPTKEAVRQLYGGTVDIQGYCKRTTVDGKVVAFEFIPV